MILARDIKSFILIVLLKVYLHCPFQQKMGEGRVDGPLVRKVDQ